MNVCLYTDITGDWSVEYEHGTIQLLRTTLKELRMSRGLKTAQLESLAGVVHPGYYNFESGVSKSIKQLPDIMDALGFDLRMVSKGRA